MKMKVKLLLLGVLSALLIYVSLPGTNLTEKVFADNGKGSTIGGVNVSGMDEDEIKKALNKAIEKWKSEPVYIDGGGTKLEIDPSKIEFNVNQTISQFQSLVDKPWYAFWKKERVVHIPLQVTLNDEIKNEIAKYSVWKTDETYNHFIDVVSYLKSHKVEAVVEDFSIYENERLSLAIVKIPKDATDINPIVEAMNDYIVNPQDTFSFNEVISEKVGNTDANTLNFVASVLYSAILETQFEILERHQQSSIPSYIDPGREAKVDLSENEDLKFLNNSEHVAKIKATIQDNKLKIEIYSDVKDKTVTVTVEEEVIKPRIINRYSRDLSIGQSKLIQSGQKGLRVNVYRTISGDGETIDDHINRSYYPPKNRIVLKSSRTSEVLSGDESDQANVDLDGDGLPDVESEETVEEPVADEALPEGSYYDKAGNLITP